MRLITLAFVASLALAGPFAGAAQEPKEIHQIGILRSGSPSFYASQHKVIRHSLQRLGYKEGENLFIEYRYAESKLDRLPALAAELVQRKVDVLVISPSPTTIRAAMAATRTIPIVMMSAVIDPVEAGFVVSLRRPGGNLTGVINPRPKLDPKRLELLKEAIPRISRVAILWSRVQEKRARKEVEAAGEALGIQIQPQIIENRLGLAGLKSVFSTISQQRPDGLLVSSVRSTLRHRAWVIDFAAKRRLPAMYAFGIFVGDGGLMSYDADSEDWLHQTAVYIDKILNGANPAELPIERPRKFELIINLKTAEALDIAFPPSILYRANKVIR